MRSAVGRSSCQTSFAESSNLLFLHPGTELVSSLEGKHDPVEVFSALDVPFRDAESRTGFFDLDSRGKAMG